LNKSLVAGAALAAFVAIGTPMLAWSAGETPPAPAQAMTPGQPGVMPPGGMGMGMGHPGWHHRMGMMRKMGGWMRTPQQRCEAHIARRAAAVAYVVSLLDLTPQQRPLYAKVQSAMENTTDKMHQLCATLKPADAQHPVTVLDRLKRREEFLQARLHGMQQVEPAMQALYQALTPAQKAIVDHPFRHG